MATRRESGGTGRPGKRIGLLAAGAFALLAGLLVLGRPQRQAEREQAPEPPISPALPAPAPRPQPEIAGGVPAAPELPREAGARPQQCAPYDPEIRTQIRLFGDAQVRPRYDERDQRVGLLVRDIQPGSVWDLIGVRDGDLLLESGGELLDDPEAAIGLIHALSSEPVIALRVLGADGEHRYLEYQFPDPEERPAHCE